MPFFSVEAIWPYPFDRSSRVARAFPRECFVLSVFQNVFPFEKTQWPPAPPRTPFFGLARFGDRFFPPFWEVILLMRRDLPPWILDTFGFPWYRSGCRLLGLWAGSRFFFLSFLTPTPRMSLGSSQPFFLVPPPVFHCLDLPLRFAHDDPRFVGLHSS